MKRAIGWIVALVGVAVVAAWFHVPNVVIGTTCTAALGLLFQSLQCRHPHAALQPSTHDHTGRRIPAHWYCDDCGKSWAAVFVHDQTPIQRFTGFDQTKAPQAAKRAAELDQQRRELALRRAGLRSSQEALRPVARASRPVPITAASRQRLG